MKKGIAFLVGLGLIVITPAVARTLQAPTCRHVRPIVECVTNDTAHFGYLNSKQVTSIPIGKWNRFSPLPRDRGQPTTFWSGRHKFAVEVKRSGAVMWKLGGNIAVANDESPACPTPTPTKTPTPTSTPTSTNTPTPTSTPTKTPTPTSTPTSTNTPTSTKTPTSTPTSTPLPVLPQNYAPIIALHHGTPRLPGPDLVVWAIQAYTMSLQIIVRNVGDTATDDPDYGLWEGSFWVDTYLNPDPIPDHVNQTWNQVSEHGMAHGVIFVLEPNDVVVLEPYDDLYWPQFSDWEFPLTIGDVICVQVDSANVDDPHGAVIESHEIAGASYNNVTCGSVQNDVFGPWFQTTASKPAGRLPRR